MVAIAPPKRECVTGEDPDRIYPTPADELFEGRDYRDAPDLRHIGDALQTAGAIKLPEGTDVTYLWKRKGGKRAGLETWGACVKSSGLVHYFEETNFIVWLAADHCKAAAFEGLDYLQIEALVFHELSHIGEAFDKEGNPTGEAILVGHNFEGFRSEIERYGLYLPSAKYIAPAFQPWLPLEG